MEGPSAPRTGILFAGTFIIGGVMGVTKARRTLAVPSSMALR
jgi:hypothetical protein